MRILSYLLTFSLLMGCQKTSTPVSPTPNPKPEEKPASKVEPEKTPVVMPSNDTGSVIVSAELVKGGPDRRFLNSGDTLKSGDRFEAFVQVDKPAYVYVVVLSSDGSVGILLPEQGDLKLEANHRTRLPTDTDIWMELDNETGQEHLFFIATAAPIGKADEIIAGELSQIRAGTVMHATTEPDEVVAPTANVSKLGGVTEPPKEPKEKKPKTEKPANAPKTMGERCAEEAPKLKAVGLSARCGDPLKGLKSRGVNLTKPNTNKVEMSMDQQGVAIIHFWMNHQ
jgi:hypothetical protein